MHPEVSAPQQWSAAAKALRQGSGSACLSPEGGCPLLCPNHPMLPHPQTLPWPFQTLEGALAASPETPPRQRPCPSPWPYQHSLSLQLLECGHIHVYVLLTENPQVLHGGPTCPRGEGPPSVRPCSNPQSHPLTTGYQKPIPLPRVSFPKKFLGPWFAW